MVRQLLEEEQGIYPLALKDATSRQLREATQAAQAGLLDQLE